MLSAAVMNGALRIKEMINRMLRYLKMIELFFIGPFLLSQESSNCKIALSSVETTFLTT